VFAVPREAEFVAQIPAGDTFDFSQAGLFAVVLELLSAVED